MSDGSDTESRRTEFNRFQTFALGPYVATITNAHFDPYREGLRSPGLSRREMERVERIAVPLAGR